MLRYFFYFLFFFQFIDKFNEVKEATRSAITKVNANGGSVVTPVTSANASPITARAATAGGDGADNLLEPPGNILYLEFVIEKFHAVNH